MKICPTRPTLCIFPAPYCERALRGPPGPRAAMGHRLPVLVQHCPCAAGMAAAGAGPGPAAVGFLALVCFAWLPPSFRFFPQAIEGVVQGGRDSSAYNPLVVYS